jgi:hypothetical protein
VRVPAVLRVRSYCNALASQRKQDLIDELRKYR